MTTLCTFRDINRAIATYEQAFLAQNGMTLNEGMLLCCIAEQQLTATDIAHKISLSNSNCSKIIKLAENKKLIYRTLGDKDKRQMYFSLTSAGKQFLLDIYQNEIAIPDLLKPIFQNLLHND